MVMSGQGRGTVRFAPMRGVIAAGHPLTARAGADALRAGGNAVDAACAAVLMSFVAESPLSGPGAGGFMLVHTASGEDHLLDFFVAAPGHGLAESRIADLVPIDVRFSEEAIQRFNVGPSSCGVYGTPLGICEALQRFGTMPLGDLTAQPARAARDGIEVTPMQAFLFEILGPILAHQPEGQAIYAPGGRLLRTGQTIRLPELGDLLGRPGDLRALVEVIDRTNRERTEDFLTGLHAEGYLERFMAHDALESAAHGVKSKLGSTTHISVLDDEGGCATVTCSNGSCSGVIVPGTGMHLNNMLGEQDLNPLGFHRHVSGRRIPSMMAPTVVLRDGRPEVALGSAGSNRIRSAILQSILNVIDEGMEAQAAVERPRIHFEDGVVEAEPGVDPDALAALERDGWRVQRWREKNLYFGGAQAVKRDPDTGELSGGGDPRRGGVAVLAD